MIAGWTGRDKVALEKHIRELEELGVKRPASTPIFYRVSAQRLTTDGCDRSSRPSHPAAKLEYVLLQHGGKLWVGIGSDHTDREVETYGITVSKQICEKPLAPVFWPVDEVGAALGQPGASLIHYREWREKLYQEGKLSGMLSPERSHPGLFFQEKVCRTGQ